MTREEATQFYHSKSWLKWSNEDIVKFQTNQDKCCIPLDAFFKAAEAVTGRKVYSHELYLNIKGIKDELEGIGSAPVNHNEMLSVFNFQVLEL